MVMNENLKRKIIMSSSEPSEWIKKYLKKNINNKNLLDLACGSGRHSIYASSLGYKVTSVDINKNKLSTLTLKKFISPIQLNIEEPNSWPFIDKSFNVVIVTNYLHRPIFKHIISSIKLNGILLYETFSKENSQFGRPNNPDYLLNSLELFLLAKKYRMEILNYEENMIEFPNKKAIQRIYAKIK